MNTGRRRINIEEAMNMEPYEKPEMEVIEYEDKDVITESVGNTQAYPYYP